MSFYNLYIKNCEKVSIKDYNLFIKKEKEEKLSFPLSDIRLIIFEDPNIVFTVHFINKCSEHYITVLFQNNKHTPSSMVIPLLSHYNNQNIFYLQLNQKLVQKNLLWEAIIKQKINNQLAILQYTIPTSEKIETLKQYLDEQNEDILNKEGSASKILFKELYGSQFIRFYDDSINSCLNYGYKIISSYISTICLKYGLDTRLGIWHSNMLNNFNLSYDLIEPFRPLIDYYTYLNLDILENPLQFKVRKDLINLLDAYVLVNDKKYKVCNAIEELVKSFVKSLKNKSNDLKLPRIIKDIYGE